ncbi:uncharacterized protein LOC126898005 [Daktulosphaira vitifoliae]|uniref:uncharacterized protein LOC126898005 n=1 Tax=Daktulosphaira vitifoliae TaxID=58002 RepID=UPI0021AB06D2|nr:uncharacterized protein LOC126898005 [Daktulosphaira vitifoliae]
MVFVEVPPTEWTIKKIGLINALTVTINKINELKMIETFLEPLIIKNKFEIRLCCCFYEQCICPYFTHLDVFSPRVEVKFSEKHLKLLLDIIFVIQNYSSENNKLNNAEELDKKNSTDSENKSNDNWVGRIKKWIYNYNDVIIDHNTLKIGFYVKKVVVIPNIERDKLEKPSDLVKITYDGLTFKVIKLIKQNSLKVFFKINKSSIVSDGNCTCTLQDCYNFKRTIFESFLNTLEVIIIFVDMASIALYFPKKTILNTNNLICNNFNMDDWIQSNISVDLDILTIRVKEITIKSGMNCENITDYFKSYPASIANTENLKDLKFIPWILKINNFECFVKNYKTNLLNPTIKLSILDPFNISCNLNVQEKDDIVLLKPSIVKVLCNLDPIHILITTQNVSLICDLLVQCTHVYLTVFSNIQYHLIVSKLVCGYYANILEKKSSIQIEDDVKIKKDYTSIFVLTLQSFSITIWNNSSHHPYFNTKILLTCEKIKLSCSLNNRNNFQKLLFKITSISINHFKK